jgi:ectoine hydroxylase
MHLSQQQLRQFEEDGFLILPNLFSPAEVEVMRAAMDRVLAQDVPTNFREKKTNVVRTAWALHERDEIFARLARHPRFVEPAQQIAGPNLYNMQSKINVKEAFTGEVWQWHQDFPTHHADDGVPRPEALNLHVFLDDVSEFNGPLHFIKGSQRFGPSASVFDTVTTSHPIWAIPPDVISDMVSHGELVAAKGKAGTAMIFGECIAHCSPPNLSPMTRAIFSLILNPIANCYTKTDRPDYIHHRDLTPVRALHDGCLLDALHPADQTEAV